MDQVILEKHCDIVLKEDDGVLALAYKNSHFQTGLKNVLDRAVLAHAETHSHAKIPKYSKVDEIPFDFHRSMMSVVVRTPNGNDKLSVKVHQRPSSPVAPASNLTVSSIRWTTHILSS